MTHHINFERTTVLLFFNLDGNAMKIRPLVAMGSYRICSGSAQGSVILHNRVVKFGLFWVLRWSHKSDHVVGIIFSRFSNTDREGRTVCLAPGVKTETRIQKRELLWRCLATKS